LGSYLFPFVLEEFMFLLILFVFIYAYWCPIHNSRQGRPGQIVL
jgi:hypothetical protein